MAETPKYNIHYPDNGTGGAPTSAELGMMAQSVDDALDIIGPGANYYYGPTADRVAKLSALPNGALWFDTDTDVEYRKVNSAWKKRDTGWLPITDFSNGWVAHFSATPGVRQIDNLVKLRGEIQAGPTDVVAFTLPSGVSLPPMRTSTMIVAPNEGYGVYGNGYISTTGQFRFNLLGGSIPASGATTGLDLSGLTYFA